MSGISTRFAFKILSKVFNFDHTEVAANPVHLMYVLEQQIEREQFPPEIEQKYLGFIKEYLAPRYAEFIGKEIQTAYLESYSEYGQNIFDRYVTYADYWIQDQEYRDTDTGEMIDRGALNAELEKIEKPAGISNPKDFRNEIVNFVLRARANNAGQQPGLDQLREAARGDREEDVLQHRGAAAGDHLQRQGQRRRGQKKHEDFVDRMVDKGYTRQAGAPAVRVVPAGAQESSPERRGATSAAGTWRSTGRMLQQIIDRRLAGKNKSIGNRERFLRRYKDQIREAVRDAVDGRGIRDIEQRRGDRASRSATSPSRCSTTARAARARWSIRATRSTCAATASSGPRAAAAAAAARARPATPARARTSSSSPHARRSSWRSSSRTWSCRTWCAPSWPRRPSARATAPASPATARRPTCTWCARCAARSAGASRIGADARRELRELEEELAPCWRAGGGRRRRRPRSRRCEARDRARCARASTRMPFIDPFDLRYRNRVRVPVPTSKAVMFCLMDVSGSMDEARKDLAKRFFILLYLFLTRNYEQDRRGLHPPPHQAQEVDEQEFFHSTRDRRHRGLQRAGADGRDHPRALRRAASGTSTARRPATATTGTTTRPLPRAAGRASCCRCAATSPMWRSPSEEQNLWEEYAQLRGAHPHFAMRKIDEAAEIYPVFRELFKKEGAQRGMNHRPASR